MFHALSLGFVVYLDVLGTSDSTDTSKSKKKGKAKENDNSLKDSFNEFRKLIKRWFPLGRFDNKLNIFGLSDSLFLTLDTDTHVDSPISEDDENRVREFFESLRAFQLDSLKIGKPIRGGVAFGEYDIDNPKSEDKVHMILGRVVIDAVRLQERLKMVGVALVPPFAVQDYVQIYKRFIEFLKKENLLIRYPVPCDCGLLPTFLVTWEDKTGAFDELMRRFKRTKSSRKLEDPYPKMAKYIAALEAIGKWDDKSLLGGESR